MVTCIWTLWHPNLSGFVENELVWIKVLFIQLSNRPCSRRLMLKNWSLCQTAMSWTCKNHSCHKNVDLVTSSLINCSGKKRRQGKSFLRKPSPLVLDIKKMMSKRIVLWKLKEHLFITACDKKGSKYLCLQQGLPNVLKSQKCKDRL